MVGSMLNHQISEQQSVGGSKIVVVCYPCKKESDTQEPFSICKCLQHLSQIKWDTKFQSFGTYNSCF